jgi:glycosyltransferase involved in cell wall biosynthesis
MSQQKNIAIVVQRYGEEIHGGAETHCRLLAKQLNRHYAVTILTTVAKDYTNWEPFYKEGLSVEDGINVHRFSNKPRGTKSTLRSMRHKISNRCWYHYFAKAVGLNSWFEKTFQWYNPSAQDHVAWLEAQGPATPDLLTYIHSNKNHYDVFIFFSLLYYPTALGVQLVKEKSILIPTVHDEKASYYPVYKTVMQSPAWIVYNSAAEKKLAEKIYSIQDKNNVIAGIGIELPKLPIDNSILKKYKITGAYVVYIGRIEKGKGCNELINFFIEFKKTHPSPIQLVMIGKSYMKLEQDPAIIYTGFVEETEKLQLLLQSTLLIVPSKFESLSMVLLEALYYKKPVLVNQQSQVLQEHVLASNGGLSYTGLEDFKINLDTLLTKPSLLEEMGEQGSQYVRRNYSWQTILSKFNLIIDQLTGSTKS